MNTNTKKKTRKGAYSRGTKRRFPPSLRSWRYFVGSRFKFWRRSRVPKKGSRDEWRLRRQISLEYITTAPPPNLTRHSNMLQRLRRQISLDYYTIPPATQASVAIVSRLYNSSKREWAKRLKDESH